MRPIFISAILFVVVVVGLLAYMHKVEGDAKAISIDTSFQPILNHSAIVDDSETLHKSETDTLKQVLVSVIKDVSTNCDSLKRLNDSLRQQLFIAKYKVERVKYYIKICQRNPKQTKYLLSWVHRAVQ